MSLDDATPEQWDKAAKWDNVATRVQGGFDPVNKPSHYNQEGIEAIKYIKQQVPDFSSYLEGNLLKYIHRWKYKNGVEDLQKAQWYLDRLLEELSDG